MKRWIGSFVLAGLASVVIAQTPFTIVHPSEGARVREKVHVQIPIGSIPPGGYVGVFLDGVLIQAVVPPKVGKYYDYVLDTKARGIPDTPEGQTNKLELVLYTDYQEKARIVDRSSVNIRIGNEKNIPIPDSGIKLRYKFVPGQEMIYDLDQHIQVSQMTDAQNQEGDGKAATFDAEGEQIRLSYTVVNAYPNGDGLLRLQPLPLKGKDYADLTAEGDTAQKRWYQTDMAPLYMRISTTGHEQFGALPAFIGLEGMSGTADTTGLLAAYPLPTLPQKAVHKDDDWPSSFQNGALDLNDWVGMNSIVERFPAKGKFVGAEWERGHPCAKISNSIEEATQSIEAKKNAAAKHEFTGDKVSLTETIWFALDTHEILKIERDSTIDRKVDSTPGFGGGFGGGPGAPPGMPPMGMGRKGGGAGMGGGAGSPGGADFQVQGPTSLKQSGMGSGLQIPGKGGRGPMGPMGPGGRGPGGFGGQNGAPQSQAQPTFVRLHILQTFTLEK
jgi:hypothetical protein